MAPSTATPGPRLLTKRDFLAGLQCQVVPALVSDMRYHGMEVAEGRAASRELARLLFGEGMDSQERSVIRESLLAYC